MFGLFKSKEEKVLGLVGGMFGASTRGIEKTSEASEWLEELDPKDPRRKRVPKGMLKARYYLISITRDRGFVFRVNESVVEVRLPFDLVLPGGVKVPESHLFKSLPVSALSALGEQRAQKVLKNLTDDAAKTFQAHHRSCRVCFKRIAPRRYPGHPNEGILGPPAHKFITCDACAAGQADGQS